MGKIPEILEELRVHFLEATTGWGPKVGETGLFAVSNYMLFLFVALVVTAAFWVVASRQAARVSSGPEPVSAEDLVPRGLGNLAEAAVEFVRNSMVVDVMGKEGLRYFPFVATMFFFVLFNNVIGLIPGSKPGTGTMGTTVTWAVLVFILYWYVGIRKNGLVGWLKSFVPSGVPKLMAPFLWVLEFLSHLIRPVTLSVRLFANMFAGHVVLGVFALFTVLLIHPIFSGQIRVVAPIGILTFALLVVFYAFELFVAFIQAYVFAILTAVYIGGALHAAEH